MAGLVVQRQGLGRVMTHTALNSLQNADSIHSSWTVRLF